MQHSWSRHRHRHSNTYFAFLALYLLEKIGEIRPIVPEPSLTKSIRGNLANELHQGLVEGIPKVFIKVLILKLFVKGEETSLFFGNDQKEETNLFYSASF